MWEQIRSNQIRSIVLVVAMGLILLLLGYGIGLLIFDSGLGGLIVALIVWFIMNLVAYFQGGNIMLSVSGARKITRDDHPRLYNTVEEMKIASGLEKMPDIYIIEDPALNAFATGRDPNHASVAVTSGLLQKLNRDELQGVVAHEISHIKNRDVLLMTLCSVLLGTIVLLAWFASRMLIFGSLGGGRSRGSSSGGGYAALIIMIIAIVLMIVAPIAAQLIYFAVSRRREYLADASGALYTRYPEGLASALEKIANSTTELKSANQAYAPMYILNPFRRGGKPAADLTSTHPPISERIRILRSMGGNVSLASYENAYRQTSRSSKGVIPSALVAGSSSLTARQPEEGFPEPDKTERTRETSDAIWRLSHYETAKCECGAKLKIPPQYRGDSIKCPHCGRTNLLPSRKHS